MGDSDRRRARSFSPSAAIMVNRPKGGGGSQFMIGASLLLLSLVSIYQSQHCALILPLSDNDEPTSFRGRFISRLDLGASGESIADDDFVDPASIEVEPPPPLKVSEEEAIKTAVEAEVIPDVAGVTSTSRRSKRVKQVNATIVTSPTSVTDPRCICSLQSRPLHAKTLARFFVFQRDGRQQLRDFVTHYTRVLPYNSLVIMDHAGTDEYTQSLLKQYGEKGAHIWRCQGSFKSKASLWTKVIHTYAADTGFVFPVDIDELLTVKVGQGLVWNLQVFKDALYPLSKLGKPFKMNWIESVPSECHVHMKELAPAPNDDDGLYASDMCDIRFVKTKDVGCMDKTFSRGAHFYKTDTGNHYGGTRRYPQITKQICEDKGLTAIYDISTLALVHMKEKTFEDWLIHGLRGATDRGFHKDFHINCNNVKQSLHYCHKWEKITQARFSPYELRKVYVQDVCPDPKIPLLPVQDSFCDRAVTDDNASASA